MKKTIFITELGVNQKGNKTLGKKLIDVAADARVFLGVPIKLLKK